MVGYGSLYGDQLTDAESGNWYSVARRLSHGWRLMINGRARLGPSGTVRTLRPATGRCTL
jgi:hypothetical protein